MARPYKISLQTQSKRSKDGSISALFFFHNLTLVQTAWNLRNSWKLFLACQKFGILRANTSHSNQLKVNAIESYIIVQVAIHNLPQSFPLRIQTSEIYSEQIFVETINYKIRQLWGVIQTIIWRVFQLFIFSCWTLIKTE